MSLPQFLEEEPTLEQISEAEKLWKWYMPVVVNGKLLGFKLKYKKDHKPCGCS
jgi:hypothetical protein